MPEFNNVELQAQAPMEATVDSGVITQQPSADAQPQMSTEMGLRGGCGESIDCCGITESCGCC